MEVENNHEPSQRGEEGTPQGAAARGLGVFEPSCETIQVVHREGVHFVGVASLRQLRVSDWGDLLALDESPANVSLSCDLLDVECSALSHLVYHDSNDAVVASLQRDRARLPLLAVEVRLVLVHCLELVHKRLLLYLLLLWVLHDQADAPAEVHSLSCGCGHLVVVVPLFAVSIPHFVMKMRMIHLVPVPLSTFLFQVMCQRNTEQQHYGVAA